MLKMKYILLLTASLLFLINLNAQTLYDFLNKSKSTYEINGTIKNATEGDTLILGFYRTTYTSAATFAKDTAVIKNNKIVFSGKDSLAEGMYFIFDKKTTSMLLPLIVSKQKISFECDIKNMQESLKFINSPVNTTAAKYQEFLQVKMEERRQLENQNLPKEELNQKIEKISEEINNYRQNIITKNSDNFFGMFLKTTEQIIIPESITEPEKMHAFYKSHYWDNFNLKDERILNTSNFYNTLNDYIDKFTHKDPDSLINSIDILTNLASGNEEMFKFIIEFSFYKWEKELKNIMGMDKILVHITDNYIQQNLCEWMDSTRKANIIERAEQISPNLIGKKAAEFIDANDRPFMKDLKGKTHTLSDIQAKYTLLVFYGPSCGHCKKEMPKVKKQLDSLVNQGIDIKTFAVATEFDKKEWEKFIKEQNTSSWLNVADIRHQDVFYIFKDKEKNMFVSSDIKSKYNVKRIEVPAFTVNNNQLNIETFKQVKQQYKDSEFILSENKFSCLKEKQPVTSSDWREKYDIYSTPVIYLLDKEKKILAKRITHKQIAKVIKNKEKL